MNLKLSCVQVAADRPHAICKQLRARVHAPLLAINHGYGWTDDRVDAAFLASARLAHERQLRMCMCMRMRARLEPYICWGCQRIWGSLRIYPGAS
jgi:hypothetical protein